MSWLTSGIYRMKCDDSSNASHLFLTHNFSLYNIQEKNCRRLPSAAALYSLFHK